MLQNLANSLCNLCMIGFTIFLLISAGIILWSIVTFGPIITVPLLAGALGLVLGVFLFVRGKLRKQIRWVVVDGSNVLYWNNEDPALHSVRVVIERLVLDGFRPVVWFDANVGYLVRGHYMSPSKLSKALGFPARQISVAPKGTPADPLLISEALKLDARIVTNDRFRDWEEKFPQVTQQDRFLRGTINKNTVRFK